MITRSTLALFAVLGLAVGSEAAEQGVATPQPNAAAEQPWRDAGPPSPPELLEMVIPGSEWREENNRCVVKIDERTASRGRDDLKGTITYPDGRTKQLKGFVAGGRMIFVAPYELTHDERVGTAIAPMEVVDGKAVIVVEWHKDHVKDPNRKAIRLVSPLKPPPRRPKPNDT
ncbi:MAG: hypothetical protein WCH77_06375 [Planctomycetota bacterium]